MSVGQSLGLEFWESLDVVRLNGGYALEADYRSKLRAKLETGNGSPGTIVAVLNCLQFSSSHRDL